MERELPSWLDGAFLATVLQGGEDNGAQVSVINFSANPAVAAGNNYTSFLYRVQVEYKVGESPYEESTSLMVKAPITKGFVTEMANDFFGTEPKIYSELLPQMTKKIKYEFGPKSFHCPVKNGLVLKDMKEEGYIMCDRYKQLDYLHCKYVFITLAKFHAASVACHHDNPDFIETIGEERLYVENSPFEFKSWLESCVKTVAGMISHIDEIKSCLDLLSSRADQLAESAVKMCKPKTSGLNVLNHGDLWVNNMLFQHNDTGKLIDIKFIDFQLTRFASPVLDLIYFIWTSANEDVRETQLQNLFNIYLQTLNKTLEELECEERLTSEELQEDLKSAINWGLITICNVVPFIICESEDVINMEDLNTEDFKNIGNDQRFKKLYNGKHYKAILPTMIKQFLLWTVEL